MGLRKRGAPSKTCNCFLAGPEYRRIEFIAGHRIRIEALNGPAMLRGHTSLRYPLLHSLRRNAKTLGKRRLTAGQAHSSLDACLRKFAHGCSRLD